MKKSTKKIIAMGILALIICAFCSFTAFAASDDPTAAETTVAETTVAETTVAETAAAVATQTADNSTGNKAIAAAVCVGLAAAAAAIGMGIAIAKSSEGISRQPEAAGSIRTSLMLGLVFIETAIIYALIIAILIIFVL